MCNKYIFKTANENPASPFQTEGSHGPTVRDITLSYGVSLCPLSKHYLTRKIIVKNVNQFLPS